MINVYFAALGMSLATHKLSYHLEFLITTELTYSKTAVIDGLCFQ